LIVESQEILIAAIAADSPTTKRRPKQPETCARVELGSLVRNLFTYESALWIALHEKILFYQTSSKLPASA
jgi:hypothetical protein